MKRRRPERTPWGMRTSAGGARIPQPEYPVKGQKNRAQQTTLFGRTKAGMGKTLSPSFWKVGIKP